MNTLTKLLKPKKTKTVELKLKGFSVVNGNDVVQETFATLEEATKFAQETGFKVI